MEDGRPSKGRDAHFRIYVCPVFLPETGERGKQGPAGTFPAGPFAFSFGLAYSPSSWARATAMSPRVMTAGSSTVVSSPKRALTAY